MQLKTAHKEFFMSCFLYLSELLSDMKEKVALPVFCIILLVQASCIRPVPKTEEAPSTEEANNIRSYLSDVAKEITDKSLSEITSLPEWQDQRSQRYDEFIEMMGLQDMPLDSPRPDLKTKIYRHHPERGLPN